MQVIVLDHLDESYAAVNPASVTLYNDAPFDDALLETIRRVPEVVEAEGRRQIIVQFKTEPDGAWHPFMIGKMMVGPNAEAQRLSFKLLKGKSHVILSH